MKQSAPFRLDVISDLLGLSEQSSSGRNAALRKLPAGQTFIKRTSR
ncbi:hypothetical protein [Vibrio sp. 10N.222.55.E7]